MLSRTSLRRRLVTTATALVAVSSVTFGSIAAAQIASAAPSASPGLYGAADPTYDGVYRQSLALMGLVTAGVTPAAPAVSWLLGQQCPSGAFQSFRADPTAPCDPVDAVNFTGPDTNSTAMAAMGLMSLLDLRAGSLSTQLRSRVVTATAKAIAWLGDQQNPDGGWPWTTGGASDANSTGLTLSALLTQAANEPFPAYVKGSRYLGRLTFPCTSGGGLAYQGGGPANALATAQGLTGLAGPVPVAGPRRLAAAVPCANTAKAKAASYLATRMAATGTLPTAIGDGPDYATTANAVLGLVSAKKGRAVVARATSALKAAAPAFTTHSGGPDAGALGLLLLVAEATGSKPTSFGGVNLVSSLVGSIQK